MCTHIDKWVHQDRWKRDCRETDIVVIQSVQDIKAEYATGVWAGTHAYNAIPARSAETYANSRSRLVPHKFRQGTSHAQRYCIQ